ncbi:MAG TPA: trypsin-like peptidase domain-containing protein [Candidatus Paceibacterota bacterium]|nr:trypsin-like peptidase domain-containing protein [Candidatus Paceibacterota bacterium]
MNPLSPLIAILLSIGSFLGFPYTTPPTHKSVSLPGLEQRLATTSFSTYAPLVPTAVSVNASSTRPSNTSTSTKKEKLPTLAIQVPAFPKISVPKTESPIAPKIPVIQTPAPNPVPVIPNIPIQPASSSFPSQVPATPPQTPPANASLDEKARAAIVNIYCTSQSGNLIEILTGSGVIIDPKGIILTNAHVADHLLLDDYFQDPNKQCVIRRGSPAVAQYKASLVHISEEWLRQYGANINNANQPQETGAGDYALVAVTAGINGGSVPGSFPYLSLDTSINSLSPNTSILGVGYPASSFSGTTVMKNLPIQTALMNVIDAYTFTGTNSKDLIRTTASSLAERGASGGGILNQAGQMIALIATTVPDNSNTSEQDIQAITLNYINVDLKTHTGYTLSSFLNRDIATLVNNFKNSESTLFNYLPH